MQRYQLAAYLNTTNTAISVDAETRLIFNIVVSSNKGFPSFGWLSQEAHLLTIISQVSNIKTCFLILCHVWSGKVRFFFNFLWGNVSTATYQIVLISCLPKIPEIFRCEKINWDKIHNGVAILFEMEERGSRKFRSRCTPDWSTELRGRGRGDPKRFLVGVRTQGPTVEPRVVSRDKPSVGVQGTKPPEAVEYLQNYDHLNEISEWIDYFWMNFLFPNGTGWRPLSRPQHKNTYDNFLFSLLFSSQLND